MGVDGLDMARIRGLQQGRVDQSERWRTTSKYGDLGASGLQAVFDAADRGDIAEWCDLCEYMIKTDEDILDAYTTRVSRVVQASWQIDGADAKAVELVKWGIDKCDNWHEAQKDAMHALAPGFSALEGEWEYDAITRRYFVRRFTARHGHRFRYDEQWQLRLYDRGQKARTNQYGEALDPRRWVVHTHKEQPGYPGVYGVMRSCAWPWLFKRWAEKFWIMNLEKHGSPFTVATVPGNTPSEVRTQIRTDLESMATDHVAVKEAGVEIEMLAAGAAAGNDEAHLKYVNAKRQAIMRAWLGTDDATSAGESGSRAAVDSRISAVMDPRMVSDGEGLATTLRSTYFRQLMDANAHEVPPGTPVPSMRYKTAGDEARVDVQDLAEEDGTPPAPETPPSTPQPKTPPTTSAYRRLVAALRQSE